MVLILETVNKNLKKGFPKLPKIIKVHHNNLIKPKSILVK